MGLEDTFIDELSTIDDEDDLFQKNEEDETEADEKEQTPDEEESGEEDSEGDDNDPTKEKGEGRDEEDEEETEEDEEGEEGEEEAQVLKADQKVKLKIKGEEREKTLEEVINLAQISDRANDKFNAAKEESRRAQEAVAEAQKTYTASLNWQKRFLEPDSALEALRDLYTEAFQGDRRRAVDTVEEIVQRRVKEIVDLTNEHGPEALQTRAEEQYYEWLKNRNEAESQRTRQEAEQRENEARYDRAAQIFVATLESEGIEAAGKVADYADRMLQQYLGGKGPGGLPNEVTQQDVDFALKVAQEKFHEEREQALGSLTPEEILKNAKLMREINKRQVEAHKAKTNTRSGPSSEKASRKRRQKADEKYYSSFEEFHASP